MSTSPSFLGGGGHFVVVDISPFRGQFASYALGSWIYFKVQYCRCIYSLHATIALFYPLITLTVIRGASPCAVSVFTDLALASELKARGNTAQSSPRRMKMYFMTEAFGLQQGTCVCTLKVDYNSFKPNYKGTHQNKVFLQQGVFIQLCLSKDRKCKHGIGSVNCFSLWHCVQLKTIWLLFTLNL